ncbi:hypothetical protein SC206_12465 [Rouxiella sp. T17]|uniref:winged helix-turn-helix domain-containing protein n=1 Tax=Rouxiella sp. T17 TaxID=3085684 RepID=UPI002FC823C1
MTINNQSFEVTEKHKRLVICLLKDITLKNDIINVVWFEQAGMVSDNNYHQLIHKFRNLLCANNLPKAMLKTIPRHGAMLDLSLLPAIQNAVPLETKIREKKTNNLTTISNFFTATFSMISKSIHR